MQVWEILKTKRKNDYCYTSRTISSVISWALCSLLFSSNGRYWYSGISLFFMSRPKLMPFITTEKALEISLSPEITVLKVKPKAHFPMMSSARWVRSVWIGTSEKPSDEFVTFSLHNCSYKNKKVCVKFIKCTSLAGKTYYD